MIESTNLELPVMKILNRINENNISMVIDTSGSMYKNFNVIKDVCVLFLKHFSYRDETSFNIYSFSRLCSSFSEGLVNTDVRDNIILATAWMQALQCDTTSNTLSALVTAFDDNTDALVLFTDGMSTQKPTVFIRCITEVSEGRPVHVVYINLETNQNGCMLKQLAANTNGTFQKISNETIKSFTSPGYQSTISDSKVAHSCKVADKEIECQHISDQLSVVSLEDKCNLLGKTVLAKRSKNGCYYKGVIVKQPSNEACVIIVFQLVKHGRTLQQEELCNLRDVILYDPTASHSMCSDDIVLVHFDLKGKYLPAQIKSSKYIYNEDNLSFTQVLDIELPNKERKQVPKSCVVPITCTEYMNIVKELGSQCSKCNVEKQYNQRCSLSHGCMIKDEKKIDQHLDDLNLKIEQQVVESKVLMEKLRQRKMKRNAELSCSHNIRSFNRPSTAKYDRVVYSRSKSACPSEHYDSGFTDDEINYGVSHRVRVNSQPVDRLNQPSDVDQDHDSLDDERESLPPQKPDRSMKKELRQHQRAVSAELPSSFKEPHPPASWKTLDSKKKRRKKYTPVPRYRSASVGRNIVERSKKHWVGRPVGRETCPKRSSMKSFSEFHRNATPQAEEYQTADGVPLPIRTDRKFHVTSNENWFPDKPVNPEYQYHDIVAHRTVDFKPKRHDNPPRRKFNRMDTNGYKHRLEWIEKDNKRRELKERNEMIQRVAQKEEQVKPDGCTKIHIMIDKNAKGKVTVNGDYLKECPHNERREVSQQTVRNVSKNVQTETQTPHDPNSKNTQTINFNVKRDVMQKNRIQKEIEAHESKIERLKEIRKKTDARILYTKEHDKIR